MEVAQGDARATDMAPGGRRRGDEAPGTFRLSYMTTVESGFVDDGCRLSVLSGWWMMDSVLAVDGSGGVVGGG